MRLLVAILLATSARLQAEVAVLNPQVSEHDLSPERVRDILLGRVSTWNDGKKVVIIVSEEQSADATMREIAGRDTDRLLRGWKRLVFAGEGAMPQVVATNRLAVELVAQLPGAIALLPAHIDAPRCLAVPLQPAAP